MPDRDGDRQDECSERGFKEKKTHRSLSRCHGTHGIHDERQTTKMLGPEEADEGTSDMDDAAISQEENATAEERG